MAKKTYFESRVYDELGITPEQNKITLYNEWDEKRVKFDIEIFSPDENDNIRILPFSLDRMIFQYDHPNAKPTEKNINNNRQQTFYITRLKNPEEYTDKEGNVQHKKYNIPKGAGTHPFITPGIIEKFEKKKKIDTLVLTEGYFKAFKGYIHGLDIIGLSSITHYKSKETGTMYFDIIRVIKECKVKNIVILYDGDCLNISTKAIDKKNDLYTRPGTFLASATKIHELLKDYLNDLNIALYFAHIDSENAPDNAKGLDDLLVALKGKENQVIDELTHFSSPGHYIIKKSITPGTGKLVKYFAVNSANSFYEMHSDVIGHREFIFRGTCYKYDEQSSEVQIIIPKAAKDYFRVGDYYYEFVWIPNKHKALEKTFHRRMKSTITDDHGAKFVKHIPKYKAFCNVPDHVNFVQIQNNCFNMYSEFEHEPSTDDTCEKTLAFIKHIFGDMNELGLDYVQLLYQQPTQILPILCLVSRENSSGKSTFIKLLKAIFTTNCTIIGNEELSNAFNASYASKLIIACEESFIEKQQIVEKIKALSTADNILMNAKGKDHVEIDFFGKFILLSNNEDSFIYATANDIRYWVIKVPVPKTDNVNLLQEMIEEIPYFLHFLNTRKMSTKNESRMWFKPELLRTEALEKLIANSRPRIEKELLSKLKNLFFEFHESEYLLTARIINKEFFNNRYEESYISKILRDKFNCDYYRNTRGEATTKQFSFPRWQFSEIHQQFDRVDDKYIGRPFILKIENFLSASEIKEFNNMTGELKPPEPDINEIFDE